MKQNRVERITLSGGLIGFLSSNPSSRVQLSRLACRAGDGWFLWKSNHDHREIIFSYYHRLTVVPCQWIFRDFREKWV